MGFSGNYRYTTSVQGDETTYVFVDCSRELSSFHSFLSASVTISCIGWLAVLVIVTVALGAVIRPMVESYSKQKRFITDASHEIKTPLAVIDAANEVQEIESGESEWTQSIHEQVARLTALAERLVFLARMDEGSAGFTMAAIDLSEAVDKATASFESVAVSRGAGKGSAELVVSNAVDELPEGDLDRLFDRFYRADVSRSSKTGGSGVPETASQFGPSERDTLSEWRLRRKPRPGILPQNGMPFPVEIICRAASYARSCRA